MCCVIRLKITTKRGSLKAPLCWTYSAKTTKCGMMDTLCTQHSQLFLLTGRLAGLPGANAEGEKKFQDGWHQSGEQHIL